MISLLNDFQLDLSEELRTNPVAVLGFGQAFGTFGELLQGMLPNGRSFLVTLPIQKYSRALFIDSSSNQPLEVFPKTKVKVLQLAKSILSHYGLPIAGTLLVLSEIPEGKGMASSSADLVATANAINSGFNLNIPTPTIERFMGQIEPSDGVMYTGSVSYYYLEAKLRKQLGYLPELVILAMDEGGQVDTIEFNKKKGTYSAADKKQFLSLLARLEDAIVEKNVDEIGEVSTQSARLSQKIKANKYFENILEINTAIGGLGIVVAHSGTCIGILLSKEDQQLEAKISQGLKQLRAINPQVFVYQTTTQ